MNTRFYMASHYFICKILIIVAVAGTICFTTYKIGYSQAAQNHDTVRQELSYKSVAVKANDTLWDIAKENYSKEYGTFPNYIKDIMRCNSLTSDEIKAGSSLIVPVYLPANPS